jgi:aryl carrier-like protein
VIGQAGGSDYCAANCYLDAVALRASRRQDAPVFSVNWDAWLEVGMAARRGLPAGERGMSPAQGMEALERVLAGPPTPQTLVSLGDIGERRARADTLDYGALLRGQGASRVQDTRPALSTPFVAPKTALETELTRMWCEALGFRELGVHDSLFELGGDSLTAIGLLGRIQREYGVTLYPADLFGSPTIATLAGMVELRLIEQISEERRS